MCEEWDKERLALMQTTHWLTMETIVDTLLQCGEAWDAVASFVRRVLTEKKKREREARMEVAPQRERPRQMRERTRVLGY